MKLFIFYFHIYYGTYIKLLINCRYCMEGDMGESDLKFWTTHPNAFFVATSIDNDDVILGIIGCKKISDRTTELNRLVIVPSARSVANN